MPKSLSSATGNDEQVETPSEPRAVPEEPPPSLPQVIREGKDEQITARISEELQSLITEAGKPLDKYCILSLYGPDDSIDRWDSDRIFTALQANNSARDKNVLLLVSSSGGRIEPAYQVSKICKLFSKEKFIVAVPRAAKSAATLIALGADEIHMGIMGELGPIDPQLGNLPALGVKRALETIASVCQKYPQSAEAFARYMSRMVSIEQIGYCERVAESAVQYAERLLGKKPEVRVNAKLSRA